MASASGEGLGRGMIGGNETKPVCKWVLGGTLHGLHDGLRDARLLDLDVRRVEQHLGHAEPLHVQHQQSLQSTQTQITASAAGLKYNHAPFPMAEAPLLPQWPCRSPLLPPARAPSPGAAPRPCDDPRSRAAGRTYARPQPCHTTQDTNLSHPHKHSQLHLVVPVRWSFLWRRPFCDSALTLIYPSLRVLCVRTCV